MASHKDFFFKKAVIATNYINEDILNRLAQRQQELEEKGFHNSLQELALEEGIINEEQLEVINKQIFKEMNLGVTRELPTVDRRMHATNKKFLHYEILEEVTSNSLGRIYKARNTKNDNKVSIKEFSPEENVKLDRDSFFREVEQAKNLNHPYIERIYEVHKNNKPPFFVVELLEGHNLSLAKTRKTSVLHAVEIIEKVTRALQYSHQQDIFHHNLTPENIFIDAAGEPVVTEFGIVREECIIGGIKIRGNSKYMSPEQAMGIKMQIDAKSDIFSVGVILYELLTGKLPFEGKNTEEIIHSLQTQVPVPPSTLNEKVNDSLDYICIKALEKNIEDRYQTIEEMNQDLDLYLQGKSVVAETAIYKNWKFISLVALVLATIVVLFTIYSG